MLAIRLQRTGRTGHAQFRVIVQDDRFSPKSGRVVAYVGSYDPHTKAAKLDGEKISKYLENGAQPSDRVAQLLKKEGIKLPSWVKVSDPQKRSVRNPEKLRRNRPAGAPEPGKPAEGATEAEPTAEEQPAAIEAEPTAETAESPAETPETEQPAADETPVEEPTTIEEPAPQAKPEDNA
jgi:small subunit ribosomal protein S16